MHQLILKNVGPIKNCEVSITDFNVFTGAQASGKSTIAKSVFFFRTVKDDIFNAIMKRNAMLFENSSLYKTVQKNVKEQVSSNIWNFSGYEQWTVNGVSLWRYFIY